MLDGAIQITIAAITSGLLGALVNIIWNRRKNKAEAKKAEVDADFKMHESWKSMLADRDEVIKLMSSDLKDTQTELLIVQKKLGELENTIQQQDSIIGKLKARLKELEQ